MTRPMTSAPLTPPEQALETLFSARAQRMPEDHLGVAAVLARATTLRRRRTAYRSSVALVAILAAVPLGTDLAHRWSASPSQVASGSVTGSASPTASTGAHAAWASTLTGDGAVVTDEAGKSYVDFLGGIAVNVLGHRHPAVIDIAVRAGQPPASRIGGEMHGHILMHIALQIDPEGRPVSETPFAG